MSWPTVAIKNVAKVVTGKTPSTLDEQNFGGSIPFVTPAELGLDTYVASTPRTLSDKGASIVKLVPKNAVMVCCIGSLGKMAIAGTSVATNQQINSVIFDENRVDIKFGFYALQLLKPIMEAMAPSTTVAIVNKSNFEAMLIPLPPLHEQKRIAAILDKADAIRRKRQQAIQLADDFLRAVFLDMFGDPGANPKGFNEAALGELTTGKTNNGLFRKNDEYGGSVPVAWVGELFRGNKISFSEDANRIDPTGKEIEAYGLKYGDLLFCRSSLKLEGIGFNNIYLGDDDKALFECHLIRMSPCLEKVNPIFLNYQLRMPSVRARIFQQAKTSTMTTIDQAGLSRIKVFVPPLGLQEEFERRLVKVESLYSHLCKNKSLDDLAFSSLSQKAFSGQL